MKNEAHNPLKHLSRGTMPNLEEDKVEKKHFSPLIKLEVLEKLRDYVYQNPEYNISSLVETLLVEHFEKFEKKNGPIPPRRQGAKVKTGRPIKA